MSKLKLKGKIYDLSKEIQGYIDKQKELQEKINKLREKIFKIEKEIE